MSAARLGIVLSSTLALTGCGSGAKDPAAEGSTSAQPNATATTGSTPAPPAGTTTKRDEPRPPARARTSPPVPDSSPEAAQAIRVPVRFVLAGGKLRPASVSVPSSIPIELTIVSREPAARSLVLSTRPPRTIALPPGGTAKVTLRGVPRGSYRLASSGATVGTLVVGSEPGP